MTVVIRIKIGISDEANDVFGAGEAFLHGPIGEITPLFGDASSSANSNDFR
jgi:hypothetical protein